MNLCTCMFTCFVGRGGGRGTGTPTNRLFVGNLCYDTEQSSLQELFPDATDVFIPMNRDTGKGKGLVEYRKHLYVYVAKSLHMSSTVHTFAHDQCFI